mgnify:CR=1 FL=1
MLDFIREGTFFNPSCGDLTLQKVFEELISWMIEDKTCRYEIVIATDSASDISPRFPVVITIRRLLGASGKGGRFFVEKLFFGERRFHTFRDRIWEEAQCSVSMGHLIQDGLKSLLLERGLTADYTFEDIHLDIGNNGPTKAMIAEICGYVIAEGFHPVIKPEAWATRIADRHS